MFSNTFPDRAVISETVARMLLEIEAVHFRADQPYTFTSGLASPVYIDCRKLISYPRIRSALMDFRRLGDLPQGRLRADSTRWPAARRRASRSPPGLPTAWPCRCSMCARSPRVSAATRRSRARSRKARGCCSSEDLTTDGGSKIQVRRSRAQGGRRGHRHIRGVSTTTSSPTRPQRLLDAGMRLHHLATWWDVLEVCKKEKPLHPRHRCARVEAFLNEPIKWSARNGGIAEFPQFHAKGSVEMFNDLKTVLDDKGGSVRAYDAAGPRRACAPVGRARQRRSPPARRLCGTALSSKPMTTSP